MEADKGLSAGVGELGGRLEAWEQAAGMDPGSAAPITSGMFSPWFLLGGLALGGLVLGGTVTTTRWTRR